MEIKDFLDAKAVKSRLESKTKDEVLEELTDLLEKTGKVTNREEFLRVIREREELGSTGIGYNIAIPHARSTGIKGLTGAFGISKEGIEFDALDKEPVYLFFVLAAPKNAAGDYLKALATISRLLRNRKSRQALMKADTVGEIVKIIKKQEA
ncbi:PTS sugar transporter subunit IIA [Candidatus Aerophobetes bacterium]|uniref:PTS sugar transporter subunit IIA n=1 Tax=Aerophobetes bacterium TaxID=2030807 RepID=A0A523UXG6_UNCAE|nr:MAG: PTS sugar transporter subunit IIA [Candidatus Aerophobetes bacterium]TET47235.1 MAG: PTS sugar transporter subunit IIA [Candidatus Aerophobetes bacterium]